MSTLEKLTTDAQTLARGTEELRDLATRAIAALEVVFTKAETLQGAASRLVDSNALVGDAREEAIAAAQYWATLRDLVAECTSVVIPLSRHHSRPDCLAAARRGATEGRMARWEAEWLREVTVTALAGKRTVQGSGTP
jgi:phage I-like protein